MHIVDFMLIGAMLIYSAVEIWKIRLDNQLKKAKSSLVNDMKSLDELNEQADQLLITTTARQKNKYVKSEFEISEDTKELVFTLYQN